MDVLPAADIPERTSETGQDKILGRVAESFNRRRDVRSGSDASNVRFLSPTLRSTPPRTEDRASFGFVRYPIVLRRPDER